MKITDNFCLKEFEYSKIAEENHIDNKIPETIIPKIKDLCIFLLQPIRNKLNKNIVITSGYRCKALNEEAGGRPNSQHMQGEAADIISKDFGTFELFKFIKDRFEYDQLILEHYNPKIPNSGWVHISFKKGMNRKMSLEIKG